jgi:hypothetical protein
VAVFVDNPDDLSRAPGVSVTPETLPADLDITDLVVGRGIEAGVRDTVQVQYQGVRVADSGEFDSSWSRGGAPVEFPLGQVIEGFRLGISGMREGGRRILVVPPHQGYGTQGAGGVIPPNAHLVFVVDLLKVETDGQRAEPQPGASRGQSRAVRDSSRRQNNQPAPSGTVPGKNPPTTGDVTGGAISGRDLIPSRRSIFVSYRRADTGHVAGRISDRLADLYGEDLVFVDVNSIEPGVDFVDSITAAIDRCELLLVFIGPEWDVYGGDGHRRLNDPDDLVRIEIEEGLRQRKRVIPVLVDTAVMPRAIDLPSSLAPLARRNAIALRQATFKQDARNLLDLVKKVLLAD